ncbi:MAG: hypothetical protein KatS3mg001_099 [Candidatus Pacearchaeota archaeon]|nr:MAG: hypothetical protein KatS3mg001_099 [Candidatus Pacearchaeota archaeon]
MRLTTSGNVGIGTTSPSAKLEIQGSGTGGLSLNVTNDLFVNDTSGRVGIGTATPQQTLDVVGSINTTANLYFNPDVQLFRGAANRLDLATGDSLNLVSGNLQIGGTTVITSGRMNSGC